MLKILLKGRWMFLQDGWLWENPFSSFYWEPVHSRLEDTVPMRCIPKLCQGLLSVSFNNKNGEKGLSKGQIALSDQENE